MANYGAITVTGLAPQDDVSDQLQIYADNGSGQYVLIGTTESEADGGPDSSSFPGPVGAQGRFSFTVNVPTGSAYSVAVFDANQSGAPTNVVVTNQDGTVFSTATSNGNTTTITGVTVSPNVGATGATGVGATGTNGTNGATGATGTNGTNGATGATGTNGTNGATGATGTNGTNGATGATGTNGTNGATGATGTNGTNGATGATGTNGTNGATGATGTNGTNGATGATGTNGTNGATGATGTNGTNGATGATGTNGTNGATGSTGAAGATGATGSAGATGSVGPTGATGTAGATGATGSAGATGATGPAGATGATGQVTCFVAGALISTPTGERRIEDLATGDLVMTASGARPIKWIGRRQLDPRRHAQPKLAQPVRISAGAFGEGLPKRDLYLSPRHCVAWDGVIIPVEVLINGASIVQMDWNSVEYFRLELEQHDIVWAEGLPAESYMYGGLRSDLHADFESEEGATTLHPLFASYAPEEDTCLPLVVAGPAVDKVKATLARQARTSRVRGFGIQLAQSLTREFKSK